MALICCDGDPKLYTSGDRFDLSIVNGQPVMDEGLENAAYLSLFAKNNPWTNAFASSDGERYVSRFAELQTRTLTNKARLDAEVYAADALAWMVTEGVAASVTPTAVILSPGMLGLTIVIEQPARTVEIRYQINWATMEVRAL